MDSDGNSFIRLDIPRLAALVGAQPEQIAKAGAALFSALTSGSATGERLSGSAGKKAGLDDQQMRRLLRLIEEGFRRPESLQVGWSDRIETAGEAFGARISGAVDEVRSRAASIDIDDARQKGAKALRDAKEGVRHIDLEVVKDQSKKLGETLTRKAGDVAGSVSNALKRAKERDEDEK